LSPFSKGFQYVLFGYHMNELRIFEVLIIASSKE
jgi:hypothetical protein